MKTCLRFASSVFFSILIALQFGVVHNLKAQSDSLAEVFPLAIGNQWTYRYYTESGSGAGVETITDSGRSVYFVTGSIVSTDSTQLQIRQKRDLIHRRVYLNMETTYPIHDTINFELIEKRGGQHHTYRKSDPTAIRLDVFPFTMDFNDTTLVYRFRKIGAGDTVAFKSTNRISFSPSFRSTFTFKRGVGLFRFRYNSGTLDGYEIAEHYLLSSTITSISTPDQSSFPERFNLLQNYPNPFNPTTTIRYELPRSTHVSLKVFDMLGREVATLVDGVEDAGLKSSEFNGAGLSSGIYFYRLTAEGFVETKKLVLMK